MADFLDALGLPHAGHRAILHADSCALLEIGRKRPLRRRALALGQHRIAKAKLVKLELDDALEDEAALRRGRAVAVAGPPEKPEKK